MTALGWEIVGQDYRELPLEKSVGAALRDLIRKRYPNNAAKRIERDWDLDPKTAKNVVTSGHVSERTLTKALRAEGWALIAALGTELTGETFAQHEERRLQAIINEAENARQNIRSLAARRASLESQAADLVDALDGQAAHGERDQSRSPGRAPDHPSDQPPRHKPSAREA